MIERSTVGRTIAQELIMNEKLAEKLTFELYPAKQLKRFTAWDTLKSDDENSVC